MIDMRLVIMLIILLAGAALADDCPAPASITVPAYSTTGSYIVSWAPGPGSPPGACYELVEASDQEFTSDLRTVTLEKCTSLNAKITGKTDGSFWYRVRTICGTTKYWAKL